MDFNRISQIVAGSLPWIQARRRARLREAPERIVLPPRPGHWPSTRPPVRIFVGTEPAQYRAERVFIWSIEQVRDPARTYEIYLMKELAGFDRRLWLTRFTNYRFAIPHLAGGQGRAIYNDVDQVYLTDPAELFDIDMRGHGILVVPPMERPDTSVMLIDCERMVQVWGMREAQKSRKKTLLKAALSQPGLVGEMAPEWNARDEEYEPGRSRLLHFTTIHWQPWQPFPDRYVYQHNPVGHVWHELERSADAAGYQVFDFNLPSAGYRRACGQRPLGSGSGIQADAAVRTLLDGFGSRSILHYVPGERRHRLTPVGNSHRDPVITRLDPAMAGVAAERAPSFDAAVCTEGLDYLEDDDLYWVLDSLFARARQFVYLRVGAARAKHAGLHPLRRSPAWWFARVQQVSRRYPRVHWRLDLQRRQPPGVTRRYHRWGGAPMEWTPSVWVLTDEKPGHTTQSLGLARALGFPYEVKHLRFNLLVRLGNVLLGPLGPFGARPIALKRSRTDSLEPPWPDVVLATGWRPAPVVRWIGARSFGRTRTIQLGRKGGRAAWQFDAAVTCGYFRLPAHPNRIEPIAPLNQVSQDQLDEAARRFEGLFGDSPGPYVALLVGGSSRRFRFEPETARRLGEQVRAWADAGEATVFAITSRRTGEAATRALEKGLGEGAHVHRWSPDERGNSFLGYLARADALVVTGESESMMAEAAATGKPVYIYPIPERRHGPWVRLEDWVEKQARARRVNKRGKVRPQQGLEYVCAWLIARGIVQPRRDLSLLQRELIDRGIAHAFGAPLETSPREPLREAETIARRIRGLLALPASEEVVGKGPASASSRIGNRS